MKEITGKSKLNSNRFSKSINVNVKAIKKSNHIAQKFNNEFFIPVQGQICSARYKRHLKHLEIFYSEEKNMEYRDLTFE